MGECHVVPVKYGSAIHGFPQLSPAVSDLVSHLQQGSWVGHETWFAFKQLFLFFSAVESSVVSDILKGELKSVKKISLCKQRVRLDMHYWSGTLILQNLIPQNTKDLMKLQRHTSYYH